MDEAHVVKRLHGSAEVERQAYRGAEVERRVPRQSLAQTASLDEFHRREDPARLELTELLHANQSRMGRRRRDNRPAPAQNSLRGVGRGGKPPGQQPYRDPVAGRLVLGKTHASEGARPQLADDPVATLNTQPDRHPVAGLDGRHARRTCRAFSGVATHGRRPPRSIPLRPARQLRRESSAAGRLRDGCRSQSRSKRRSPCTECLRVCPVLPAPSSA